MVERPNLYPDDVTDIYTIRDLGDKHDKSLYLPDADLGSGMMTRKLIHHEFV